MHMRFRFSLSLGFLVLLLAVGAGGARAQDDSATDASPTDSTPAPQLAGKMVTLGDFGDEDIAYLSLPATPPSLGIVLVPDIYGLDDFTKGEADRLAKLGFVVLAVDTYNGHHSTDPAAIATLLGNLDVAASMKAVDAGIRLLHESRRVQVGHVVVMGWGTGARFAFQAARENKTLDGAILFYGPVETDVEKIGKFLAPVCAVYPNNDPTTTHAEVQVFEHMMKDAGNDFSAWFIAAGAGWSNPASKNYNAVEDREAWKVAMPFLVRIGAEPVMVRHESMVDKMKDKVKDQFNSIFH